MFEIISKFIYKLIFKLNVIKIFFDLYRTVLIANNVQVLNKEVDFLFTTEDVKKIKKFAHQKGGVSFLFLLF